MSKWVVDVVPKRGTLPLRGWEDGSQQSGKIAIMTSYPINYTYDHRDGASHEGFAATPEEVSVIITRTRGDEWVVSGVREMTTEVTSARTTREEVEADWADEIAAGYASIIQTYHGFAVEITYWETEEEETERT